VSRLWALSALVFVSILTACSGGDDGPPTSDVAGTPPWTGDEQLQYVLKADSGREVARGVLVIDVLNGRTNLAQSFTNPDETNRDDLTVQVDSQTLKPFSATRRILNDDDDDVELIEVTYTDEGALIKLDSDKQSGLSVPEHSYDNDTSLFLWRTLPFAEGYEASYNTIITNHRNRQKVNLRVTGKESVTVPAGQFTAWRLEIRAGGRTQVAWYADTTTRPLIKYDNDAGTIFELETRP
jgi:hypothetical protein